MSLAIEVGGEGDGDQGGGGTLPQEGPGQTGEDDTEVERMADTGVEAVLDQA